MKNNAGFQTIALTRIHESTTNPRSIFDESKLAELAATGPPQAAHEASRLGNRGTSLASLELR